MDFTVHRESKVVNVSSFFQGLASLLGRYLVTLSCSPKMSSAAVGKIIVGLAEVRNLCT